MSFNRDVGVWVRRRVLARPPWVGADTPNCSLGGGGERIAVGVSVVCILAFSGAASLKRKTSLWSETDLIYKERASKSVEGKRENPVKTNFRK